MMVVNQVIKLPYHGQAMDVKYIIRDRLYGKVGTSAFIYDVANGTLMHAGCHYERNLNDVIQNIRELALCSMSQCWSRYSVNLTRWICRSCGDNDTIAKLESVLDLKWHEVPTTIRRLVFDYVMTYDRRDLDGTLQVAMMKLKPTEYNSKPTRDVFNHSVNQGFTPQIENGILQSTDVMSDRALVALRVLLDAHLSRAEMRQLLKLVHPNYDMKRFDFVIGHDHQCVRVTDANNQTVSIEEWIWNWDNSIGSPEEGQG